jgi:hypothetical protein
VEGAVVVVRIGALDGTMYGLVEFYLGKKATMKIPRKIRVFLRFVSKGICIEYEECLN